MTYWHNASEDNFLLTGECTLIYIECVEIEKRKQFKGENLMSIKPWMESVRKDDVLREKAKLVYGNCDKFQPTFHDKDSIKIGLTYISEPRKSIRNKRYDNCGRKRRTAFNGVCVEVYDNFYKKYVTLANFKTKKALMEVLDKVEVEVTKTRTEKIKDIFLSYAEGNYHLDITMDDLDKVINEIETLVDGDK